MSTPSLCVASATHGSLFHHALFSTTGWKYLRLLYSQHLCLQVQLKNLVFKFSSKDGALFWSCVCVCVYMPSFEMRKEGSGPGLCLQVYVLVYPPLLPAIKTIIKVAFSGHAVWCFWTPSFPAGSVICVLMFGHVNLLNCVW